MAPTKFLDRVQGNGSPHTSVDKMVFKIRPLLGTDPGRVSDVVESSHRTADPRSFDLLRRVAGARWAVAELHTGAVAGMVGAAPLGEIGVVCHLAVRQGYRKAGLGAALSSWAVSYLESWGVKTVRLHSTYQAEGLFLSLGFEPVAYQTIFRLESAGRAAALSRLRQTREDQRVSRLSLGDLPELCGVDRRSRGMDRSALILDTLKAHPGPSYLTRDAFDRITGYLLSSAQGGTIHVGPFVATTPGVAEALLAHILVTRIEAPIEVVVPEPESPAVEILKMSGFTGRQDRLRMELGEKPVSGAPDQYGTTPYLST